MARAPAPQPPEGFRATSDGRVVVDLGGGAEVDVTKAIIKQISMQQDTVDVTSIGDPFRQVISAGGRHLTLELYLEDEAFNDPPDPGLPPEAPEEPQERAERRARLELPPEGERPAGRKLGRRRGR